MQYYLLHASFLVIVVCVVYFASAIILPFPNWGSVSTVARSVFSERRVETRVRVSMLGYIARELLLLPVWAVFWIVDEVYFSGYHTEAIERPIFIISQPRSGTTFLLRTLSEDKDSFLSVKHLEWRYPYISFWKLLDLLNLHDRMEERNYWPNSDLGKSAAKIHQHVLGNYEEFGIFFEERFFHHYFTFRRFPFIPVLCRVSAFSDLSEKERDRMIETFLRVVRKVYHYRGQGEIFLAKENENVELCKAIIGRLPDARILMACREPQEMLDSYLTMSVVCTEVKHGLNPAQLPGWHDANIEFRRSQCMKFIEFWHEVRWKYAAILVSYSDLTSDVMGTIESIYNRLNLPLCADFAGYLRNVQRSQNRREKGYQNLTCNEFGFEFYGEFVAKSSKHYRAAE